jgi:hypothetical protein
VPVYNDSDLEGFEVVPFSQERQKVLAELDSHSGYQTIVGQTDDHQALVFKLNGIRDQRLVLEIVEPATRPLRRSESIVLLFGLSHGQYLVRTTLESSHDSSPTVFVCSADAKHELRRLQRRSNFRVAVGDNSKFKFKILTLSSSQISTQIQNTNQAAAPSSAPNSASNSHQSAPLSVNQNKIGAAQVILPIIDLSVSGVRVKWPLDLPIKPLPGGALKGAVVLPSGQEIAVEATVRILFSPVEKGARSAYSYAPVGLQFQGLSGKEEQDLLFACLQIFRAFSRR